MNTPQLIELKCPICGKTFVPAPEHIYRDKRVWHGRFVCSYSCVLKSERMKNERGKKEKTADA